MAKQDYYELLNVQRNASESDLKSAFRKMAMRFHPDRNPDNPDAEKSFKEVNEAYDVLKDGQKRAAYDQFGHAGVEGNMGGGFDSNFSFEDIFSNFFGDSSPFGGGGGGRRNNNRGSDLQYEVSINLEEAFNGKKLKIDIPTQIKCNDCSGSGSNKGSSPSSCPMCNGHGQVRSQQGFFSVQQACPQCRGKGEIISDPCKPCRGAGRIQKNKSLMVNIPKGVDDGSRIRLSGEGEAGLNGGQQGDLYIFVSLNRHNLFIREDDNLFSEVPVSVIDATIGGTIDVPTIDGGKARLKIPAGTQSGDQFRLKSKGMPAVRGSKVGDLYIQAKHETPVKLNKKQIELLQSFQEISTDSETPLKSAYFKKAKDFWKSKK